MRPSMGSKPCQATDPMYREKAPEIMSSCLALEKRFNPRWLYVCFDLANNWDMDSSGVYPGHCFSKFGFFWASFISIIHSGDTVAMKTAQKRLRLGFE